MTILEINIEDIKNNFQKIQSLCDANSLELVTVSKVCLSHAAIVMPLIELGAQFIADCYFQNMAKYSGKARRMALKTRVSDVSRADECEVWCLSDMKILEQLSARRGQNVSVMLNLELGDMRDGIELDQMGKFLKKALKLPGIEVYGVGGNLGCLMGKLPDTQTMEMLDNMVAFVQKDIGYTIPVVSLGGTLMLDMIKNKQISPNVNQVRIGEAIFFGYNMSYKKPIPEVSQKTFRFSSEILEIQVKNIIEDQKSGYNAFGQKNKAIGHGKRKRAVLDFGELAGFPPGLEPLHNGMELAGYSHNHTVVDVTDCEEDFAAGDLIHFRPNYSSTAHAILSPFVDKKIC